MFTTLWMCRQEYQHHKQLPLAFNCTSRHGLRVRCGLIITVLQHDLGKRRAHGRTACGAIFGGAAAEPVCHAR